MSNWPRFSEKILKKVCLRQDKQAHKIHIELWLCLVTKNVYDVS